MYMGSSGFFPCEFENPIGELVQSHRRVWATHVRPHPAGVDSQYLEAARPQVIVQDFGLHIERGL